MNNGHLSNSEFRPRKWILYVLIIINIIIVIILANKFITDRKAKGDEGKNFFQNFFEKLNNAVDASDDEFDKRSFNSSFEMYVGTEWGSSVSRLIDKVITNNKTNDKHIITVVFEDINSTDSDEIRSIKKSLEDWTEYEVILDYDENGYVNLITIEK